MGIVYLARGDTMARPVAIECCHVPSRGLPAGMREQFILKSTDGARLSPLEHCPIHHVDAECGLISRFHVKKRTSRVHGTFDGFKEFRVAPAEIGRVGWWARRALAYAHLQGNPVHRDVKSRIFLLDSGVAPRACDGFRDCRCGRLAVSRRRRSISRRLSQSRAKLRQASGHGRYLFAQVVYSLLCADGARYHLTGQITTFGVVAHISGVNPDG
jgi:hypothetical protein